MSPTYTESFDQRCIECPVGSLCATSSNTTDIFCIVRYKLNEIPVGNSCSIPLIVISLVVGLLLLLNTISVILIIRRRRIQVYDLPSTLDERSAVYRAEVDLLKKSNDWAGIRDVPMNDDESGYQVDNKSDVYDEEEAGNKATERPPCVITEDDGGANFEKNDTGKPAEEATMICTKKAADQALIEH